MTTDSRPTVNCINLGGGGCVSSCEGFAWCTSHPHISMFSPSQVLLADTLPPSFFCIPSVLSLVDYLVLAFCTPTHPQTQSPTGPSLLVDASPPLPLLLLPQRPQPLPSASLPHSPMSRSDSRRTDEVVVLPKELRGYARYLVVLHPEVIPAPGCFEDSVVIVETIWGEV